MAYSFLEPIRVGKMVLKNRIIVPAMARYLCEDGFATEDYIRYYEAMAKGGVAMVTVGIMPIDLGWPSTTALPALPWRRQVHTPASEGGHGDTRRRREGLLPALDARPRALHLRRRR